MFSTSVVFEVSVSKAHHKTIKISRHTSYLYNMSSLCAFLTFKKKKKKKI